MNHAQQEPATAPAGRTSRRRALGALAAGGFGAGLAATLARTGVAWDGEGTPAVAAVGSDATSPFSFRLAASAPETFAGGTVRSAGSQQIAAAAGVSIKLVDLEPGGMRELHWHPNAAEINYCLEGEGIVGILSATGETATFAIGPGSIGYMPKGDAHYIRNTGPDTMRLVLGFSDAAAENLDFSACLPWVPSDLINQTLGVPAGTLPMLPVRGDLLLVQVEGTPAEIPSADPTPFSTTLDHLTTQAVAGGAIHPLRVDALPRLETITVFDLVIDGGAVREPHWHGNASEFNYCVRGAAQLGIVAPSGESWTFTVEAGDVAFVPENWYHYIANVGDEPAEFLAFFTNTAPSHVELSAMADYFPPEVMAASFGIDPGVFAALPKRGTVVIAPPLGADDGEGTPPPATPAS